MAALKYCLAFICVAAGTGCLSSSGPGAGGAPIDPVKLADVPGDDRVPLHLYVSNQSWDPELVDIRITMNGTEVVEGDFAVEGQHNWIRFDLMVPRGTVDVRAEALDGTVMLEQSIEVPDERWAALDFWYYPDEDAAPYMMLTVSDEQILFAEASPALSTVAQRSTVS